MFTSARPWQVCRFRTAVSFDLQYPLALPQSWAYSFEPAVLTNMFYRSLQRVVRPSHMQTLTSPTCSAYVC